jgi:hypothetical protein
MRGKATPTHNISEQSSFSRNVLHAGVGSCAENIASEIIKTGFKIVPEASTVPNFAYGSGHGPPPATRSELFTRFGPLLKSPWEVKFKVYLQGEIDVCENRDIFLFWWLVAPEPPCAPHSPACVEVYGLRCMIYPLSGQRANNRPWKP